MFPQNCEALGTINLQDLNIVILRSPYLIIRLKKSIIIAGFVIWAASDFSILRYKIKEKIGLF